MTGGDDDDDDDGPDQAKANANRMDHAVRNELAAIVIPRKSCRPLVVFCNHEDQIPLNRPNESGSAWAIFSTHQKAAIWRKQVLLVVVELLARPGRKLEVRPLDDGVDWAGLLTEAAVDALMMSMS